MEPRLPRPVAALALVAAALFLLPLAGLAWRTPWSAVLGEATSPAVLEALGLSLRTSLAATLLALVLGLPLALWLAAGRTRLRAVVRVLVTLPMVLPPVVAGVALLLAFGRGGLVGGPLEALAGWTLPFTWTGVVLAQTYVAAPFLVLTVEGGLRGLDPRHGRAAATLGAGPWRVLTSVTLPSLAPTLRAGLLVAWARALGEFGATITFAGNLAGETRTMPLAVYRALEDAPETAIVLSLVLVAVSAAVLFVLRDRWFPAPSGGGAA